MAAVINVANVTVSPHTYNKQTRDLNPKRMGGEHVPVPYPHSAGAVIFMWVLFFLIALSVYGPIVQFTVFYTVHNRSVVKYQVLNSLRFFNLICCRGL